MLTLENMASENYLYVGHILGELNMVNTLDVPPNDIFDLIVNGTVVINGLVERYEGKCDDLEELKVNLCIEYGLNGGHERVLQYFDNYVNQYCTLQKLGAPPHKLPFEKPSKILEVKAELELRTKQTISKTTDYLAKFIEKLKVLYQDVDCAEEHYELYLIESLTKSRKNIQSIFLKLEIADSSTNTFDNAFNKLCAKLADTFLIVYLEKDGQRSYYLVYCNIIKFDLTNLTKPEMLSIYLASYYAFDLTWLTKQKPI
ncbi:unnamed protein product [Didymodactylos carnosus]|uniref:Uncharacterized protein n=1 Tax=Didymodactylos carnosus TaxID=1234261 RepID=A0A814CP77_9BILA|nr:unnamed protein product [Didymodactylos carnosus]CAF3722225.1 unnamed protein product [Didymodactylos carnosus]